MSAATELTQLLERQADGREGAMEALVECVYDELCAVARRQMARERPNHTLNTKALVNEAYLELAKPERGGWKNRAHFFGVAGLAMKQILIQHARRKSAKKRGERMAPVAIDGLDLELVSEERAEDLLLVHDALAKLERIDKRARRVVELRIFVGLGNEEVAEVLDVSKATVKRDWTFARAWLNKTLGVNADPLRDSAGAASGRRS